MNISMVIPTYWSREKADPWHEGDAIYDHPTPIDGDDTLGRTLESIKSLKNQNFKLIIPVCPTTDDIEDEAERRVREIVKQADLDIDVYLFTQKNLRNIKAFLREHGLSERANEMLNLKGYSNVRNICIYCAQLLSSDVTMLIDDDEIFENDEWVDMATEFIGKRIYGKGIYGVAGYYLNKYDEFYDDVDIVPWMTYWNRFGSKTKAFDKIISCDPRLKVTPFAFGGAMVIHKNLFRMVPFDSAVRRGEDIDYVLNSKMFGFDFFLDNKLSIKHLPPKKNHPIWKRFREDIYRFLYEQAKINSQYEVNNMNRVTPEDFDPYPGDFMKHDLEDKIFKTNMLLALEYLSDGNIEGCRESIRNVYLSKYEALPKIDPFTEYRKKQKDWTKLIELTIKHREILRREAETNNVSRVVYTIDYDKYANISKHVIVDNLRKFRSFERFTDTELARIAQVTNMRAFNSDERLFKEGSDKLELFLILKGCVRIVKYNDSGEEVRLGTVCSNGVIGETFLVQEKEKYNSTGLASEFVEVLTISKQDLEHLIANEPDLGNKLLMMFIDALYFKLNRTNIAYKEQIQQDSNLSEMN